MEKSWIIICVCGIFHVSLLALTKLKSEVKLSLRIIILESVLLLYAVGGFCQGRYFSIASWNVENAFDTIHDSGKDDYEFLPEGNHRWNGHRFWKKLRDMSKVLVAVDEERPLDLIGLCEVENDSVVENLLWKTPLNRLGYKYVMTCSEDARGVDVALLYSPKTFQLLSYESLRAETSKPTRDVLHVCGVTYLGDTLDVYLVHLPSKLGAKAAEENRRRVVEMLLANSDSCRLLRPNGVTIVMGDFNDELGRKTMPPFLSRHFIDVIKGGKGGTYKYQGKWSVIDHILLRGTSDFEGGILSLPFLLEPDAKGGEKPYRTFLGPRYNGGISDHLPIWVRLHGRKNDQE